MFFLKKGKKKPKQTQHSGNSLYPVLHVIDSLNDYKRELIEKEVESLRALNIPDAPSGSGAVLFQYQRGGRPFCGREESHLRLRI